MDYRERDSEARALLARRRAHGAMPLPLGNGKASRYTRSSCVVAERPVVAGRSRAIGNADRGPRYTVPAGDGSPVSGCTALSSPTAPTQSRRCP